MYHSFGAFTALAYFNIYPETKIKGIIDLAGCPIQMHWMFKVELKLALEAKERSLFEEADVFHKKYLDVIEEYKKMNIQLMSF